MDGQKNLDSATQANAHASRKKYLESRACIVHGLLMLLAGSVMLLCCKLQLPGFATRLLALGGGGVILFGNGYILFGLLIYADSRTG